MRDQNITLRTQMSALENQTKEAEARADRFHEKLLSAEARLDRLQSQSLSMAHSSPKANAPSGSDAAPSPVQRESLTKPPPPVSNDNPFDWNLTQSPFRVSRPMAQLLAHSSPTLRTPSV